jgi:hypothetical protein
MKKLKRTKQRIDKAREDNPEHVDWELCANTVDTLHIWIQELCEENHRLKATLEEITRRICINANVETKAMLDGLNLQDLDSMGNEDR